MGWTAALTSACRSRSTRQPLPGTRRTVAHLRRSRRWALDRRQLDDEVAAALAWFGGDVAACASRESLCEREPEAGAGPATGGCLAARPGVEDGRLFLDGHAGSRGQAAA